ncbi:CMD domain-containing protein [Enterobacteriaceae bacterium C23F]
MEQSRAHGKSHWYHETQSRNQAADVLPLVPEAAHFADRFLLDLTLPPFSVKTQHWLELSRQISAHLFPDAVAVTRLNTFSAYERLSTALTVAQVFGVQRLCNHYAARLAPLPGPDSSRESNHRLAQITQYARQLAGSPSVIGAQSREQLDAVGLTAPDSVLITQIVGFISYQARVVAAGQALLGLPVRWIPGMPMQDDAPAECFTAADGVWHTGLECRELADSLNNISGVPGPLAGLLVWDEELCEKLSELLPSLVVKTELANLTDLLCARINGSPDCFQQSKADALLKAAVIQGDRALRVWQQDDALAQATIQAVQLITRAPDRFSAAQFSPLCEQGLSAEQAFTLLAWSGVCGWINRLKIGLGGVLPDA